MHHYNENTTLPPTKKPPSNVPNGKLFLLVDLKRIKHLFKHDFKEHNHSLTIIADVASKKNFV